MRAGRGDRGGGLEGLAARRGRGGKHGGGDGDGVGGPREGVGRRPPRWSRGHMRAMGFPPAGVAKRSSRGSVASERGQSCVGDGKGRGEEVRKEGYLREGEEKGGREGSKDPEARWW